jgi:L-2-hydroxyglutarate oxidase LhgO
MRLGPYSWFTDKIDYTVDEKYRRLFYDGVKDFLPFIEPEDLTPNEAGIQAKTQAEGGPDRDFIIEHEHARGLDGLISLVGIDSPGLTASPAIGAYVTGMVDEISQ